MPLRVYRSCSCIRSKDKITAKDLSSSRTSYLQRRVSAMSIRDLLILNLTLQIFDGLFPYQVFSLGAAEANPVVSAAIANWGGTYATADAFSGPTSHRRRHGGRTPCRLAPC